VLARPADDLVHALKYEGWPELASLMAEDMARVVDLRRFPEGRPVVVPIPTTPRRLRGRGYNQAEVLARCLAERLGLELRHALVRTSESRSQTTLTPTERQRNVRGAFSPAARGEVEVRGAHVLLVDDVLTTGATAGEAATVLARMGARSVTLVAFARALPSTVQRAA
jgi:ComF family protein